MMRETPETGEQVILVDEQDRAVGTCEKLAAHRDGGRLHRAFSVFVLNSKGELLLQQRAAGKYHFAGRWSNTCCSHPRPGESVLEAATRRLLEELRLQTPLHSVGTFLYSATDEASGLTEQELDHLLVGSWNGMPQPDPEEVAACRWESVEHIAEALDADPGRFTPWFALAFEELRRRGVL